MDRSHDMYLPPSYNQLFSDHQNYQFVQEVYQQQSPSNQQENIHLIGHYSSENIDIYSKFGNVTEINENKCYTDPKNVQDQFPLNTHDTYTPQLRPNDMYDMHSNGSYGNQLPCENIDRQDQCAQQILENRSINVHGTLTSSSCINTGEINNIVDSTRKQIKGKKYIKQDTRIFKFRKKDSYKLEDLNSIAWLQIGTNEELTINFTKYYQKKFKDAKIIEDILERNLILIFNREETNMKRERELFQKRASKRRIVKREYNRKVSTQGESKSTKKKYSGKLKN